MKNFFAALALLFAAQMSGQTSIPAGNYVGVFKQINTANGNKSGTNTVKITATTFVEDMVVGTVRYSAGCTSELIYKSNDGAGTFTFEEKPLKSTDAGCQCDGDVKLKKTTKGDLEFVHQIGDMMVKGVCKNNSATRPAKN